MFWAGRTGARPARLQDNSTSRRLAALKRLPAFNRLDVKADVGFFFLLWVPLLQIMDVRALVKSFPAGCRDGQMQELVRCQKPSHKTNRTKGRSGLATSASILQ